ncbi:poly [ADP-ribose] polymerase 2 [Aegilops tauschii subsp. strangulata]|uniref:Poly [ADP-ribose] polymerase n=5 Tax=Aegilops tauschii subsp. strangulata TaxID=200361 RepID=A0A453SNG0_AEGTS|nr:poly [ADP-ribose] polymerase 2-A [Aegilops tauschii subsp. strangulata]
MSAKLRVEELRADLQRRGLDASGTKPALVLRLDAAIREEGKVAASAAEICNVDGIDGVVMDGKAEGKSKRKRKRHGEGENEEENDILDAAKLQSMGYRELQALAKARGLNANGGKKDVLQRLLSSPATSVVDRGVQDKKEVAQADDGKVEELKKKKIVTDVMLDAAQLQGMGYRELQALAKARGLAANGIKKDVIERLLSTPANSVAVADGGFQDKKKLAKGGVGEVEEEVKKEKIVKATKKGAAVLDEHIPDDIKMTYHVLQVGDEIYDATLNQTNVGDNNNKYYIIQALESDAGGSFMVFNRWGRVGARGQQKLHPCSTRDEAIDEFEGKFEDKTKNSWSDRKNFERYAKKYTWLEMDYGEVDKETTQVQKKGSITDQIKETKLETRTAQFISLICNISMMKQQMMEIGYNADKLPLGKLSKSTILKGYDVLKRISNVISRADRRQLEQLTGEFYTVIPHDFGFKKMREFLIDTPQKLKAKLEMVEALGEIEIATKLLEDDSSDQEDPLYARYKQLHCDFTPLEVHSKEYSMIKTYLTNTHGKTHSGYTIDILQMFKVSRHGETERFQKFASAGNRMLLWHGSRLSNWAGIFSQGLRIAPPEAPVTGYMFGKGVYFADMFSKSANYCYASQTSRSGVLLLCEVALGDMNELLNAKYDADNLPKGKLSTKGVGQMAPAESKVTEDGVVVPLGKPKEEPSKRGSLLYNEYIVYNVEQIRMRYVLHVSFNFKGGR